MRTAGALKGKDYRQQIGKRRMNQAVNERNKALSIWRRDLQCISPQPISNNRIC
ncbi:unnamed protein product [Rhodiola kirilowii]